MGTRFAAVKKEAANRKLDEEATTANLLRCIDRLSKDGGEGWICE